MAGDAGWIRLHRKALKSAVFRDPHLWHLWSWCKMRANWEDTTVFVDRLSGPVPIKRGQFVTGRESLNRDVYPDRRKSDPSASTTWRRLKQLEKMGNLLIESNRRFSIVTVVNFEVYNPRPGRDEQPNDPQVTRSCPTGDPQVNTDKKNQEVKEEEKKKPPTPLAFPEVLDTVEFRAAWKDWVRHRNEIKKPLKPTMVGAQLRRCEKLGHAAAIAMIENTIEKGYVGLLEPDSGFNSKGKSDDGRNKRYDSAIHKPGGPKGSF